MIQELTKPAKPKGKILQAIIKRDGDNCSVKHYGHPDLADMTTMLGMHAICVFTEMQAANPDAKPETIEQAIKSTVSLALELAQKEIITEDD